MTVNTKYTLFCAHPWCYRTAITTKITRCAVCQFFSFCDEHQGLRHQCLPTRSGQGKELPPISHLVNCFNTLKKPPTPYMRVYVEMSHGQLRIAYLGKECSNRRVKQLVDNGAIGSQIVVEFVEGEYSAHRSTTALLTMRQVRIVQARKL